MKLRQKILRLVPAILALTVLFTVPTLADSGPKPQLTVQVVNAPSELYYLDLLEEGEYQDSGNYPNLSDEERAALDETMVDKLLAYVPEGWHACLLEGTSVPMWGELTSDVAAGPNSFLHTFGYVGVPETYQIAIVTQSGDVRIFPTQTRQVLQSSVMVDFQGGGVKTPPVFVGYLLQFLATLLSTLAIEGALLWAFGYRLKKSWKPFLAVNLLTQGCFAVFCAWSTLQNGTNWVVHLMLFVPVEIVIAVAETVLFRRYLTERSKARATAYALTANFFSALLGFYLAEPIWRFIVSIS